MVWTKDCFEFRGILSKGSDVTIGAGQYVTIQWTTTTYGASQGITPESLVVVDLWESDGFIFGSDLAISITAETGTKNTGTLLFRFPFTLDNVLRDARDYLTNPDFLFRVAAANDPKCQGWSGIFDLDGHLSSLVVPEAPGQSVFASGSFLNFRVVASGMPNRHVICVLMEKGRLWDSEEWAIETYVTGSAGGRQYKAVVKQLPFSMDNYGRYFIRCKNSDDSYPPVDGDTEGMYGTFDIVYSPLVYKITQPTSAARWEAQTKRTVTWGVFRAPSKGAGLKAGLGAEQVDDVGIPTQPGLLGLYRRASPLTVPQPIQEWDVNLADRSIEINLPALLRDADGYYFALRVDSKTLVMSPEFRVLPAVGRTPSPPEQVPTAEPDPAPPTRVPEPATPGEAPEPEPMLFTLAPTPQLPSVPPTPFSRISVPARPRPTPVPQTAAPVQDGKMSCGTKMDGSKAYLDECGVCDGDNRCLAEAPAGASPALLAAIVGGAVLVCLCCVAIAIVMKRRARRDYGDGEDGGADIVFKSTHARKSTKWSKVKQETGDSMITRDAVSKAEAYDTMDAIF